MHSNTVKLLNSNFSLLRRLIASLCVGITLLLTGCGKGDPVKISASQSRYIGVWEHVQEDISENSIQIKNLLLVINRDSSAEFKQCFYSKTVSEDSNFKRSSKTAVNFPNATVIDFEADEIELDQVLETPIFGDLYFSYPISITKTPYESDGRWHLGIEGVNLKKLNENEIQSRVDWTCPESEDEDDEDKDW